jgi:hypothetical protein
MHERILVISTRLRQYCPVVRHANSGHTSRLVPHPVVDRTGCRLAAPAAIGRIAATTGSVGFEDPENVLRRHLRCTFPGYAVRDRNRRRHALRYPLR